MRSRRALVVLLALIASLAIGSWLLADWYYGVPPEAKATYVGRNSCVECHQQQFDKWHGSPHDKAMDLATAETVLGDFNSATLEHYGIESRMFQREGKFFISTEGHDGKLADFEVKYVFGVEPLQQYMVETSRPKDAQDHEIGTVQVLPVAWDTTRREWFYLDPPDVHEKLAPNDRLHWTGAAANWNRMCADCHSTNLQKNFDPQAREYHTTFSEIDVSCEACHGPGSLHVELARKVSPFWDRQRGYALAKLKGPDSQPQVETCARCHVRRARTVAPNHAAGEPLYDYLANELIREDLYHADGQPLDEVYVFGSFIQSKMHHKGVRCSDCHDPHSTKVKFTDNQLCISCHMNTHPAGKYDTPAHHFHQANSTGAQCVNCHMPHTTYMEVDARRDHSLRVPRPDLSVKLGTPNACVGCHLDAAKLSAAARQAIEHSHTREPLQDYAAWLAAARSAKDEAARQEVQAELDRLNRWAMESTRKWYGAKTEKAAHWATALAGAWERVPADQQAAHQARVEKDLIAVVENAEFPPMARASALVHLEPFQNETTAKVVQTALADAHPLVRFAALGYYDSQFTTLAQTIRESQLEAEQMAAAAEQMELNNPQTTMLVRERVNQALAQAAQASDMLAALAKTPALLLDDRSRLVRSEAGSVLASVPGKLLTAAQRASRKRAVEEYLAGLEVDNDWALSHLTRGLVYERSAVSREDYERAIEAYRLASRVEPDVVGPRSNLAELLDRLAQQENDAGKAQAMMLESRELRRIETGLLANEAKLLPDNATLQYRYGLSLYLIGEEEQALAALQRASELEPDSFDILLRLALLHKKRHEWQPALNTLESLLKLQPENEMLQHLLRETQAEAAGERPTP